MRGQTSVIGYFMNHRDGEAWLEIAAGATRHKDITLLDRIDAKIDQANSEQAVTSPLGKSKSDHPEPAALGQHSHCRIAKERVRLTMLFR